MVTHNTLGLVVAVGFFVIVFGLIIYSAIHRRQETFIGQVTDKDVRETVNNNVNQGSGISFGNTGSVTHQYMIKVKTDAGKQLSYQVSEGQYQIINIGDRVTKPKGTTQVEVLQKTAGSSATSPPTAPSGTIQN